MSEQPGTFHIGFNMVVAAGRNSGAKEVLVNLVRALIRAGGPEHYTLYFAREERDETLAEYQGMSDRVRAVRTPIPMFPTSMRVLRGHFYWRRQLARDGVDVFHHTYFPLPAGVERVSRTVLTLHDLIQRGMPEAYTTARRWFTNLTQPTALRRADSVVVISEAVREDVRRFHPELDLDKVEVVPNAVGAPYLRRGATAPDPDVVARIRDRYGLPDRYILGVGHLEPRKNWDRLIRAYSGIRERQPDRVPPLVVVGSENWNFGGVYEAAAGEGLRDSVVFTGFVEEEDLPEVYAQAMVFAYPSLYEGFGIPILEAMACGVPVLTSNTTSLPEVSGGAALLVDPLDEEAIADGLLRLLTDEALRAELVEHGYRNVRRYSWERSAEMLRGIYRDLASDGSAAVPGAGKRAPGG